MISALSLITSALTIMGIVYVVLSVRGLASLSGIRKEEPTTLHAAGEILESLGQTAEARQYYSKALQSAKQFERTLPATASTYLKSGVIAHKNSEFANAYKMYIRALEIFSSYHETANEAEVLHLLGVLAHDQKALNAAEEFYIQSANIFVSLQDMRRAGPSLHQLGVLEHDKNNILVARTYYTKALEVFTEYGDNWRAGSTTYQLALTYEKQGRDEEAADYFHHAIMAFEGAADIELTDVGRRAYIECLTKLALFYRNKGMWKDVQIYATRALNVLALPKYREEERSVLYIERKSLCLKLKGQVEANIGKTKTSEEYSDESLKLITTLRTALRPAA